MEPRTAVKLAKRHIVDLFGDEGITHVGLEEIEREGTCWKITIGFSRPWHQSISSVLGNSADGRAFKVLLIEEDGGNVLSVTDRILPNSL